MRLGPKFFDSRTEDTLVLRKQIYLLGIIRGHWDLERQNAARDHSPAATDDEGIDRLNTGIAIVTPIQEVLNVLNGQAAMEIRKNAEATFPVLVDPPSTQSPPDRPKNGLQEGQASWAVTCQV
jgi:hypothetical protein